MKKKIVIAGGSGFIGQYLASFLEAKGYSVTILTRSKASAAEGSVKYCYWDGETLGDWAKELDGAFGLINMAGRTVNCRYSPENKEQIMESRLRSTRVLGEAIAQCEVAPEVWVNSSSATIYNDTRRESAANDELSTNIGSDFSMRVCKAWEKELWDAPTPSATRKIAARIAITLGDGSALEPLAKLTKLGLGGAHAGGKQFFSWIHIHDLANGLLHVMESPTSIGVYNFAAPNPVTNAVFMATLRSVLNVPFGLPLAKWMLTLGAWAIMRTETELLLKSRKVISRRLPEEGFAFEFVDVEEALKDILKK